jgi:hypothetical protein
MQILSKVILGADSLMIDFLFPQQLDQDSNDLRTVELVTSPSPGVITEIVENSKVPRGKDKLDTVFDRLRFDRSGHVCRCQIRLLYLFGPAKDVISASGERILA